MQENLNQNNIENDFTEIKKNVRTIPNETQNETPNETQNETANNVESNEGFTEVKKNKFDNKITEEIELNAFKKMVNNKMIYFYDKRGRKCEFENYGVVSSRTFEIKEKVKEEAKPESEPKTEKTEKTEDKYTTRYKYVVSIRTYLQLEGDIVVMEWEKNEVKYHTKLNHPELKNWSSRMFWKC